MTETNLAPLTLEGSFVLHQFFRVPWSRLREVDDADRRRRVRDLGDFLASHREPGDGAGGWSGLYRLVGGGADFLAVHFRPDLDQLGAAERRIQRCELATHMHPVGDYVSVVELGLYSATAELLERATEEGFAPGSERWNEAARAALESEREKPYVQRRLRPRQPEDMPYICFYPMDKRRQPGQNWYSLPLSERARLMKEHGNIGRRYVDRVSQVISGSVGLDDWEWAVTLFARDPLDFKELVTEMRYDEVSAVYAEFGNFFVGRRVPAENLEAEFAREDSAPAD